MFSMGRIHAFCVAFVFIFSSLAGCVTEQADDSENVIDSQEELNRLELESQILAQTVLELEQSIATHETTIQRLNSDLNNSSELIAVLESHKLELEADSSTKNQTIRDLETQILAQVSLTEQLEYSLNRSYANITILQQQVTGLNEQIANLNSQIVSLQTEVSYLEDALELKNASLNSIEFIENPRKMSIYYGYANEVNGVNEFDSIELESNNGRFEFNLFETSLNSIDDQQSTYSGKNILYWDSSISSLNNTSPRNSSEIIAEYDIVILNHLLGDSGHWDFDNTQIAINESKIIDPNVEIFGMLFCDLENIPSLKESVEDWSNNLGINGIYLNELDYLNLQEQIELISTIRNESMNILVNPNEYSNIKSDYPGSNHLNFTQGDAFHFMDRNFFDYVEQQDSDDFILALQTTSLLAQMSVEKSIPVYFSFSACDSNSESDLRLRHSTSRLLGFDGIGLDGDGCDTHLAIESDSVTKFVNATINYQTYLDWHSDLMLFEFKHFDDIVFSYDLFEQGHRDNPYMLELISKLKSYNPNIMIYGYVTLDREDMLLDDVIYYFDIFSNYSLDGVFLDEAGYKRDDNGNKDYTKRNHQIEVIQEAHNRSFQIIINNYRPEESLGTSYGEIQTNLREGDMYLMESCIVSQGEWTPAMGERGYYIPYHNKTIESQNMLSVFNGSLICGVDSISLLQHDIQLQMLQFTYHYSLIMGIEYFFFNLGPTHDETAFHYTINYPEIGDYWIGYVELTNNTLTRTTNTGTLSLDLDNHTVQFTPNEIE